MVREREGLVPPSRERRKEAVVGEGEGNREGRKGGVGGGGNSHSLHLKLSSEKKEERMVVEAVGSIVG